MKTIFKLILILTVPAGISCTTYRPVSSGLGRDVSFQTFYDELSPYGYWVHNREYGYVWIPHAGNNFFPYATNGRWIMTQYGWTWVSDYPWGWAPFHYGRWDYDPYYGWFWFPGDEWAPAWVNWRYGDGYYGWSPMRPRSDFGPGYFNDDINRWVFVRERDFGKPDINRYYVNRRRNDEILRNTTAIRNTRTDPERRTTYNAGPEPGEIERVTGRRINNYAVRDSDSPGRRLNRNQLEIYRPRVESSGVGDERPAPDRITDIKSIRPMRERDRNYQPDEPGRTDRVPENQETGQGRRETDSEKIQNQRERDVRRQYEQKQAEREIRRQEVEQEQQIRRYEEERNQREVEKEYRQNKTERQQKINQQRKSLERQRKSKDSEAEDTVKTRRVEHEQTGNVRRR